MLSASSQSKQTISYSTPRAEHFTLYQSQTLQLVPRAQPWIIGIFLLKDNARGTPDFSRSLTDHFDSPDSTSLVSTSSKIVRSLDHVVGGTNITELGSSCSFLLSCCSVDLLRLSLAFQSCLKWSPSLTFLYHVLPFTAFNLHLVSKSYSFPLYRGLYFSDWWSRQSLSPYI